MMYGEGLGQMLSQALRNRIVETSALLQELTRLAPNHTELARLWRQYQRADFFLSEWGEKEDGSEDAIRLLRNVNLEVRSFVGGARTQAELQRIQQEREQGAAPPSNGRGPLFPELDLARFGLPSWALPVAGVAAIFLFLRR